ARAAVEKFGAIEGQAIGLQGQSYAIPTLSKKMAKLSVNTIGKHVLEFIKFAETRKDLTFLVTPIGTGIAGVSVDEIRPLFADAINADNITLPAEFISLTGVKGFNKGMVCRGFQYAENSDFEESVEPSICDRGFHFCEMPLDTFGYYPPNGDNEY